MQGLIEAVSKLFRVIVKARSNDGNIVNKNRMKEVFSDEDIFKKLKNSVAARTSLASIHAARAHKYGHHQFGPKS